MQYKFVAAFSDSGMYYEVGQIVDLEPDQAATFPPGIVEPVEAVPEVPQPPPPPPKSSKT